MTIALTSEHLFHLENREMAARDPSRHPRRSTPATLGRTHPDGLDPYGCTSRRKLVELRRCHARPGEHRVHLAAVMDLLVKQVQKDVAGALDLVHAEPVDDENVVRRLDDRGRSIQASLKRS
jgi:hypothetical protein